MFVVVSLGNRKLNVKRKSELGEARKLTEKGFLMLRVGSFGKKKEFWHDRE